eukprot:scaffold7836_cov178-Amphora_coffeaeformis.AAC.4
MSLSDLSQQVGNMMHMMNQVQALQQQQQAAVVSSSDPVVGEEEAGMYDVPRNVHSAPLRNQSTPTKEDKDVTQQVWDSFLAPKTQRVGAHSYFCISTEQPPAKKNS